MTLPLRLLTAALLLSLGCARSTSSTTPPPSASAAGLRVFHCGEGNVVLIRPTSSGIDLAWGDRRALLVRIQGGIGGERYRGTGLDFAILDEARASLRDDEGERTCERGQAARDLEALAARGGETYGVGSEPFWTIELYAHRFRLEALGEERSYEGPLESSWEESGIAHRVFVVDRERIEVEIRPGLCHDGMSGAPFPAEIVLHRGTTENRGCGLLLAE